MKIQVQFGPSKASAVRLQRHGIAFAIPTSRLVAVQYMRGNVRMVATIPNPGSNASLQVAMLKRHVAMSQVKDVLPVREYARHD